jgi:hypothetical protein
MSITRKELSYQGTIGVWVFQGPQLKYKIHPIHLRIYLKDYGIY